MSLREMFIKHSGLDVPERHGVEMMLRTASERTGAYAMVPAHVFDEIEAEFTAPLRSEIAALRAKVVAADLMRERARLVIEWGTTRGDHYPALGKSIESYDAEPVAESNHTGIPECSIPDATPVEESWDRDDLRFEGDMIRWVMNDVEAHGNNYAFAPNDSDAWKAAIMHIRSVMEWQKKDSPPTADAGETGEKYPLPGRTLSDHFDDLYANDLHFERYRLQHEETMAALRHDLEALKLTQNDAMSADSWITELRKRTRQTDGVLEENKNAIEKWTTSVNESIEKIVNKVDGFDNAFDGILLGLGVDLSQYGDPPVMDKDQIIAALKRTRTSRCQPIDASAESNSQEKLVSSPSNNDTPAAVADVSDDTTQDPDDFEAFRDALRTGSSPASDDAERIMSYAMASQERVEEMENRIDRIYGRLDEAAESTSMLEERIGELEGEVLAPVAEMYRQDTPSHAERLDEHEQRLTILEVDDIAWLRSNLQAVLAETRDLRAKLETVALETRDATVTIVDTRDTLIGDLGDRMESLEARSAPVVTDPMIDAGSMRLKVSLSSWPETNLRELATSVLQAALRVAGEERK